MLKVTIIVLILLHSASTSTTCSQRHRKELCIMRADFTNFCCPNPLLPMCKARYAAILAKDGEMFLAIKAASKERSKSKWVWESVSSAADSFSDTVSSAADSVSDTVSSAGDYAYESASSAADSVSDSVSSASDYASDTWDSASSSVSDAVDSVGDTVSDAYDTVGETVSNAADTIGETVYDAANTVSDAANSVGNTLSETASDFADTASGFVDETTNLVGNTLETYADMVEEGVKIADVLVAEAGKVRETLEENGKAMVGTIVDGIELTMKMVEDALDFFPDITNFMGFVRAVDGVCNDKFASLARIALKTLKPPLGYTVDAGCEVIGGVEDVAEHINNTPSGDMMTLDGGSQLLQCVCISIDKKDVNTVLKKKMVKRGSKYITKLCKFNQTVREVLGLAMECNTAAEEAATADVTITKAWRGLSVSQAALDQYDYSNYSNPSYSAPTEQKEMVQEEVEQADFGVSGFTSQFEAEKTATEAAISSTKNFDPDAFMVELKKELKAHGQSDSNDIATIKLEVEEINKKSNDIKLNEALYGVLGFIGGLQVLVMSMMMYLICCNKSKPKKTKYEVNNTESDQLHQQTHASNNLYDTTLNPSMQAKPQTLQPQDLAVNVNNV